MHPSRSRRDVLHIILELHRRLEDSTDWLVSPCDKCLCCEAVLLLCFFGARSPSSRSTRPPHAAPPRHECCPLPAARCCPSDVQTALKTLITLHRLMRESEPAFMEELVRYR